MIDFSQTIDMWWLLDIHDYPYLPNGMSELAQVNTLIIS